MCWAIGFCDSTDSIFFWIVFFERCCFEKLTLHGMMWGLTRCLICLILLLPSALLMARKQNSNRTLSKVLCYCTCVCLWKTAFYQLQNDYEIRIMCVSFRAHTYNPKTTQRIFFVHFYFFPNAHMANYVEVQTKWN